MARTSPTRAISGVALVVLLLLTAVSYALINNRIRHAKAEGIEGVRLGLSDTRVSARSSLLVEANLVRAISPHPGNKFIVSFPPEYELILRAAQLSGLSNRVIEGTTLGQEIHFQFETGVAAGILRGIQILGFNNPALRGTYSPFRLWFVSGETGAILADSDDLPGLNIQDPEVAEARRGKDLMPPDPVRNLSVVLTPDYHVSLTWTDPRAADFNQVQIFRGKRPGGLGGEPLATMPRRWGRYLDKTVEPGATYFYVLRSVDLEGNINLSGQEFEVTIPVPPPPPVPAPEPAPVVLEPMVSDPSAPPRLSGPFPDLAFGFWGNVHIKELRDRGIIKGFEDGTFRPQEPVSKVQVLKMAYLAFGIIPRVGLPLLFADVEPGQWYADFVADARESGLIRAFDDGSWQPHQAMPRLDAVRIMTELSGLAYNIPPAGFVDTPQTVYLAYLKTWGIVQGYEDGTFRPQTGISRAEISKVLNSLICRFERRTGC